MQSKIKTVWKRIAFAAAAASLAWAPAVADEAPDESPAEEVSAEAVSEYQVDGTLFQKIADLEQEKLLMQLEKERAQLDLELDRLAAEKIKLHMEIDTLSGRAEEQQLAIESERKKLEAEAARLEREKQAFAAAGQDAPPSRPVAQAPAAAATAAPESEQISKKYRLVDIIGAGNQLQATIEDAENGQRKKISVGKTVDGYTVKSISLDDGVAFMKDGVTETLNIGKDK
jgi:type IV pilus biogenesis protein PilP